ncbi:flippase-like domain-containing protein [Kineosporia rhizophila]|uniref:lysylphosphatidylglycerol synthase domain-containing protein n=1 Tax=Kineosporia rhizophila TaxID=84633 RepID=UPI001E3037B1|nr:flippase-like domain-containing protein [Kineosporia rhizophila]
MLNRSPAPPSACRGLLHAAGIGFGALALAWMFPAVMGTGWIEVARTLAAVPALPLAGLVLLWAAGKAAHSVSLSAAMPGLDCRRALMLSLTGSAVANVLPLGGAAGIALNYRMSRGWGFSAPAIATYAVVVNLCDVMVKLFLPLALVPLVLGGHLPAPFSGSLILSSVIGLAVAGVAVAGFLAAGRPVRRLAGLASEQAMRSPWPCGWRAAQRLLTGAEQISSLALVTIVGAWTRLALGLSGYTGLLFLLLAACLGTVGAQVPLALVLAAFCVERLLTLVGITPAGFGVVELGLAGVLMLAPAAAGADVASGILLYRLLSVGLGIPVGGVLLARWLWCSRRGPRPTVAVPAIAFR